MINCGGETRHSQPDDVYEVDSCGLSVTLGKEIARRGIPSFVVCSTGHVYKSGSSPRKETDKLQPWHNLAKWKLKAAEQVGKIQGLRYCALRLPHVYGEYNQGYFAMAICLARVHLEMEQDLELLYTKDLKVNTLHVKDAASAMWHAAEWRASKGANDASLPESFKNPDTPNSFNVVDHNDTQQEHVANALAEVFNLKVSFLGSLVSQLAKINLDDVVDDMNEVSLQTWADLIEKAKIARPGPIGPFLERDVLKDQDLSIDGSLFEATTGWKPKYTHFTADSIRQMVESYKRMGWWP